MPAVPLGKDKIFIFGNYQATRESYAASTNTTFTPTAAMLNGDFSAVPSLARSPLKPSTVYPIRWIQHCSAKGLSRSQKPLSPQGNIEQLDRSILRCRVQRVI